jgi:hypothetical protein
MAKGGVVPYAGHYDSGGEVDVAALTGEAPPLNYDQGAAGNQSAGDQTSQGNFTDPGSQTVTDLIQGAKGTYETIQQALQSSWQRSSGTGQAANAPVGQSPMAMPGGASAGGAPGSATNAPAPVNRSGAPSIVQQAPDQTVQAGSGQQTAAPPPQAPPQPAPQPGGGGGVDTTNISGIPATGQPSQATAAPQGIPTPPPTPMPQPDQTQMA